MHLLKFNCSFNRITALPKQDEDTIAHVFHDVPGVTFADSAYPLSQARNRLGCLDIAQ